ncbi:acyl-CoA dehydrogenase family protein [Sinimarinibacterium flocculans]|nr:acyl-CoA dehydrogenase family protein [Sinimarinibacterium flocculans]
MHFSIDPSIEAFRQTVRTFLHDKLSPDLARRTLRGYHELREDSLAWMKILHRQGWSAPNWPVQYGGTGWSPVQQLVFEEECAMAGAPPRPAGGLSLLAPVLYTFGSEEQKARHLPPILRGDVWWAQGFSEPNSGSDLASLRTAAVLDGEHYIVNGHKIWTTQGHFADWIFMLVRTDPTAKPQKGISFLLVDMRSPGITVRPIISIDGAHSLNEVFFDQVRVPRENLVGEPGAGWTYAKFLLEHERAWSAEVPRNKRMFARALSLASQSHDGMPPLIENPVFSQRLAQAQVELEALEFMTLRALSERDNTSDTPQWPCGSVLHVRGSELQQTLGDLMLEALGSHGLVLYPEYTGEPPSDYPPGPVEAHGVASDFLYRRATTIYGGSNEIQRNIIARSLLGSIQ